MELRRLYSFPDHGDSDRSGLCATFSCLTFDQRSPASTKCSGAAGRLPSRIINRSANVALSPFFFVAAPLSPASMPPLPEHDGDDDIDFADDDDSSASFSSEFCPACHRGYECRGGRRKMVEGGCGHARCFDCCAKEDGEDGCPQCRAAVNARPGPPIEAVVKMRNGSSGSGEGSSGGGGGGGPHGGRESGFQSYAPSVASNNSNGGGRDSADYVPSRPPQRPPPPPPIRRGGGCPSPPASVISLLSTDSMGATSSVISASASVRADKRLLRHNAAAAGSSHLDQLYPLRSKICYRSRNGEGGGGGGGSGSGFFSRGTPARNSMGHFSIRSSGGGSVVSVDRAPSTSSVFDFGLGHQQRRQRTSGLFSSVRFGDRRRSSSRRSMLMGSTTTGRGEQASV